jgi:prophage regulatory protein
MAVQLRKALAILRLRQVKERTGRSRSSIYADVKAGRFPRPINIGPRAVGWVEDEIDDWLADRVNSSRARAV